MEDPVEEDGWIRPVSKDAMPGRLNSRKDRSGPPSSERNGVPGRFRAWLSDRFTIMVIPHSDEKIRNFNIPGVVIFLVFAVFLLAGLIFLVNATLFSITRQNIGSTERAVAGLESQETGILDRISSLAKTYQKWKESEENTLKELKIPKARNEEAFSSEGDLASLDKVQELNPDEIRQHQDLKQLTQQFNQEAESLRQIAQVLNTQKNLLSDIPNLWPVAGGKSSITMEFGPNRHPVTDRWFIHRGIDIAGLPDLPVVASANGKVVEAGYDEKNGYGAYVLLEHKNSIRTRYSHLGIYLVKPGDEVVQGQSIGTLGNSGLSSGYTLEFQIMIGTQVQDPASYMKNNDSGTTGKPVR